VHGFAEQSGGRVEVESAPGKGTRVTLILPRSDQRAPRAQEVLAREEEAQAGSVLLVEDDGEVAAMTREMLIDLGFRVTHAGSAEAALTALSGKAAIDLVFSDVMMPGGMSGLDLATKLRETRPELPVVLTSGYSAKVEREAQQAGLLLLPKPFSLENLAAILRRARGG
jgi:CheY-like chemotaxis protein